MERKYSTIYIIKITHKKTAMHYYDGRIRLSHRCILNATH